MPVLLFRLNGVPEDEAAEIRQTLSDNGVDFYETDAGRWGISVAAIWLPDAAQLDTAKVLIEQSQQVRAARVRGEYELRCREEGADTLFSRIRHDPFRFFIYAAAALAVLYFSLMPFLRWH